MLYLGPQVLLLTIYSGLVPLPLLLGGSTATIATVLLVALPHVAVRPAPDALLGTILLARTTATAGTATGTTIVTVATLVTALAALIGECSPDFLVKADILT